MILMLRSVIVVAVMKSRLIMKLMLTLTVSLPLARHGCQLPRATSFHARPEGDVRAGMRLCGRQRLIALAATLRTG